MCHLKHKALWLAALLVFSLSATSLPLAAQNTTGQKPIKVDATKLEGVPNFRDIGGYKTADGHMIRRNLLYRSGQLTAMTLSDNAELARLKICYEIDLRKAAERSNAPTNWGPNPPEVIDIPFLPVGTQLQPPNDRNPVKVKAQWMYIYANFATVNAPAISQVLHDLAQGDEPALLHCTAGRDRTGLTVAVLMTLLGVSRKDVYREYLLSINSVTEAQRQHILAVNSRPYPRPPVSPELRKAQTPDTSWLDAFFHSIDTNYGSFHAYVRDGLKLSNEDAQRLRRKFLSNWKGDGDSRAPTGTH
jgi:protein-tyrosine phosphatase